MNFWKNCNIVSQNEGGLGGQQPFRVLQEINPFWGIQGPSGILNRFKCAYDFLNSYFTWLFLLGRWEENDPTPGHQVALHVSLTFMQHMN